MSHPRPLRPWTSKLLVSLIVAVPVAMFFVMQAVTVYTRSGSLEDVWFIDGANGPALLARDVIVVGTEKDAKLRNRLSVVDLQNGERLTREKVEEALEFLGQDGSGLWFQRRTLGGDVHVRHASTLERLDATGARAPAETAQKTPAPTASIPGAPGAVNLQPTLAAANGAAPLAVPQPERFKSGEWLLDGRGQPLKLSGPDSIIAVYPEPSDDLGRILVSRVSLVDGRILWTAKLERQRGLRAARELGDQLVLVTAGAARDFAIALDSATGENRWVYHF